jgi:RNase adaptor protein for sRNA GlmZ degradation
MVEAPHTPTNKENATMRDYSDSDGPWIHIETFGFDHGVPETVIGALLVDLRGVDFDDPNLQDHLKGRNGKDQDVIEHVMASRMAFTKLEQTVGQAKALLDFNATKNFTLRVLIGDHDGRTRAVVVGDAVAEILNGHGIPTEVEHHHLAADAQK